MAEIHPDDIAAAPTHGRRQFLRLGGAGVVAAAVLAACTDDEETPPSETGVTEPRTETTFAPPQTTSPEDGAIQDATVTRTARTVELAMVEVYNLLLDTGDSTLALTAPIDYDEPTRTTLELLLERHTAHAEAMVDLIAEAGGEVVVEPNNGVLAGFVAPRLPDLSTEESVLQLSHTLEDLAASTYVWGTGTLSTRPLREGMMAIGGVTARQGAAVAMLLDPTGAEATSGPLFDSSGPARLPDYMLVGEGADGGDALTEAAPAEGEDPEVAPEEEEDDDGPEVEDSEPSSTVPEG